MSLFSIFDKKDGTLEKEIIDVNAALVPVEEQHTNFVHEDDAFSKLLHEEEMNEEVEEEEEEITFSLEDSEEYDFFLECLKWEVKKLKSTGELSIEDVDSFNEKRINDFKNGTFSYSDDVKEKVKASNDMKDIVLKMDEK